MANKIGLILVAILAGYLLYDKLFNKPTGGQSEDNPLGTELSMDEFLRVNKYKRITEELNRVVPEFGIPARVITYQDPTLPKKGGQFDYILLFIDKSGKLRGLGSYFIPKVAIPPHQGKTERLMKEFWKNVDKADPDSKMNFVTPDDLTDDNPTYKYETHNDALNAVWIRDRQRDRIFITTKFSNYEFELRSKLRGNIHGKKSKKTAAKTDEEKANTKEEKEQADKEALLQEGLRKHKALLTKRKVLGRDFRRLKKKRAKASDPTKKKIVEKQMKSVAMKAAKLQQMITELESTFPEGTVGD